MPEKEADTTVTTRTMVPDDFGLVVSSMIHSLYYGCTFFSMAKKKPFCNNYHRIIEHILSSDQYEKKSLCLVDDPDVVFGYSIYKPSTKTLIFVYIKKSFRGFGLMKRLVPKETKTVAHLTDIGMSILKKYDKISFDPFSI